MYFNKQFPFCDSLSMIELLSYGFSMYKDNFDNLFYNNQKKIFVILQMVTLFPQIQFYTWRTLAQMSNYTKTGLGLIKILQINFVILSSLSMFCYYCSIASNAFL